MPTPSAQAQLDSVNLAIQRISQGGQSFTTPTGVTYTAANLSELVKLRETLQAEVAAQGSGASGVSLPAGPCVLPVHLGGAGSDRW